MGKIDLNDITGRIVQYYDPEKIILFGSHEINSTKETGDIDLFIVKNTEKRPIERQIEVENIFCDRSMPLDLVVYTPEEISFLFSLGSPFIEEVMETGRLLYMRKVTEAWIKDAEEELDSAIILLEHEKYRGACYHSQQCAEKGLKAIILETGVKPERTYDIVELLNKVITLGFAAGISVEEAVFLNSIYKGRYPTEQGLLPHGEPLLKDAERAVAAGGKLICELKKLAANS